MTDHVKKAAEAHTDLTVFALVADMLEGGHLYGAKSHAASASIIKSCHREQQRLLREYDTHRAALAAKEGER